MNSLRSFWVARAVAVLTAAGVLLGVAGPLVQAARQTDESSSQREGKSAAARQTAAPSPLAARHVLGLAGLPAGAQLSTHCAATYFTSPGAKALTQSAGYLGGIALSWIHHRIRAAAPHVVLFLRGIIWPMGP